MLHAALPPVSQGGGVTLNAVIIDARISSNRQQL